MFIDLFRGFLIFSLSFRCFVSFLLIIVIGVVLKWFCELKLWFLCSEIFNVLK